MKSGLRFQCDGWGERRVLLQVPLPLSKSSPGLINSTWVTKTTKDHTHQPWLCGFSVMILYSNVYFNQCESNNFCFEVWFISLEHLHHSNLQFVDNIHIYSVATIGKQWRHILADIVICVLFVGSARNSLLSVKHWPNCNCHYCSMSCVHWSRPVLQQWTSAVLCYILEMKNNTHFTYPFPAFCRIDYFYADLSGFSFRLSWILPSFWWTAITVQNSCKILKTQKPKCSFSHTHTHYQDSISLSFFFFSFCFCRSR